MGNLTNLQGWITGPVLTIIVVIVGIIVLARAHKGDHRSALTTTGVVLIGLMVVAIGVTGQSAAVGSWMVHLFFQ
jgi:uncharacterized membrane protein